MPPRLHHTKSHNGCANCKARRVKCDEQKPKCSACVRHGKTCQYPNIPDRSKSSSSERLSSRSPHSEKSTAHFCDSCKYRILPSGSLAIPNLQGGPDIASETASKRITELELLHTYLTAAAETFSSTSIIMWTNIAPKLALSNQHLLDAILAFSALYTAKTGSGCGEHYSTLGNAYFQRALTHQRQATADLDNTDAQALFMANTLINTIFLNIAGSCAGTTENFDILNWITLTSQGRDLFLACRPRLRDTPWWQYAFNIEPLVRYIDTQFDANNIPLAHLLTFSSTEEYQIPIGDYEAYAHTLWYIGAIYRAVEGGNEDAYATTKRIIAWPTLVPERFVALLLEGNPRAWAIAAYFFAVPKALHKSVWWLEGVAEHEVQRIRTTLPPAWQPQVDLAVAIAFSPQGNAPKVWADGPDEFTKMEISSAGG